MNPFLLDTGRNVYDRCLNYFVGMMRDSVRRDILETFSLLCPEDSLCGTVFKCGTVPIIIFIKSCVTISLIVVNVLISFLCAW